MCITMAALGGLFFALVFTIHALQVADRKKQEIDRIMAEKPQKRPDYWP